MKKVLFTATVDSHILHFHLPFLKLFKDNGYEVHVATNGKETIPYCDVKHTISFERSPLKINNLRAIKQLKKVIDEEKFDIIHCHTPMGGVVTRFAAKKARKNGTRVIYTAHGFHFYNGAPLLNWLVYYPVEKYLAKYTDTLITINQEDYQRAKKKFRRRCKDIQYVPGVGVDEKKFDFEMTEKEKHELRNSLGIQDDDFVIVFPARLDKNKNQILLINAMERLVKKNKKIHLLLSGADELNGYYQKKVEEKNLNNNIHFLGYRKDVNKVLKISNVCASSSIREGLGLNLIEAIFSGLPVIALENRGHNEIIRNEINGFLVKDVNEFVDKIEKIKLKTSEYCDSKSALKFSIKEILPLMEKIYFNTKSSKKILYVHSEEKMKTDTKGNRYTDGCYNAEIWNRYLKMTNDITALFRIDSKKYEVNEAEKRFQKIPDVINIICLMDKKKDLKSFFSLKLRSKNNTIIREQVLKNDKIILRVPCDDSYIAFKYAKKFSKEVLIEVVGCPLDTLWYHSIRGKILAIPSYLKMKRCIKEAHNVLYVTNSFLQKRYPNNYNNIACSDVEITKCNEKIIDNRLKKSENIDNTIIIGTIGNVDVKYKGHKDVIKAIALLKEKNYKIKYRIVGNGNQNYLRKIAEKYKVDSIEFLGLIPHNEINQFIDTLDIYIHPSYTEGLCRSIVEAISRGCPCIVSNAGGNPELVNEEYVYKKGNVKQLSEKIVQMFQSENLKKQTLDNYNHAKVYDFLLLNSKREKFYNDFINSERKPIRVLHVVNRMGYGGIETFIMNVYRNLDKNKVQFDFAVHNSNKGEYDSEIKKLGGKIYYFPSRRRNFIKYIFSWKKFLKYNSINYTSIHMHVSSLTTIIPIKYAKKYKIKNRIVHAHSTAEIGFLHKLTCIANKKIICNYANYLLACSKLAGEFVFGRRNFQIIANGIPTKNYIFNTETRREIRNELNIKDCNICYVHVGRFCYAKNHEFLLEVFYNIHKRNKDSKLFLIGDGELKEEILNKIKELELNDSVFLLGNKNNVNKLLMGMDCFIFPSRYEGLPLSVIEAQIVGLPVFISTNVTNEVDLSNNITFIPLKSGPQKWAQIILNYKTKKIELKERIKIYDIDNMIDELKKIYLGGKK